MARRARSIWERLAMESMEGPTVTISLPREVAQELVGVLMGSLEMDGGGGGDAAEPDEDDFGGAPDGDADDMDPLAALVGDTGSGEGGEPDLDLDEPDDDSDSDDDDDDDDEPDETMDYRHSGGSPSGMRTGTALGERRRHELVRRR